MIKLLENMGISVIREGATLIIDSKDIKSIEAPYSLVKTMRASFIVLGPLLARFHEARVSLPGGCAIGTRPVDIHIKGLRELGADVKIDAGYVEANTKKLVGNTIFLDFPSVGATENIMLAASLSVGETIIELTST
jgi:UDP-N-acetylglucosamine 1-carboxyvinyltransferase